MELEVFQRVLASFQGSEDLYPGIIVGRDDDVLTYSISFDDGDADPSVPASSVFALPEEDPKASTPGHKRSRGEEGAALLAAEGAPLPAEEAEHLPEGEGAHLTARSRAPQTE